MKLLTGGVLAGAVVIAYLAAPVFAMGSLGHGVRYGNVVQINDGIDFQNVRTSLKQQFVDVMRNTKETAEDNPVGAVFATSLINTAVDKFLTPESIAVLVKKNAGIDDKQVDFDYRKVLQHLQIRSPWEYAFVADIPDDKTKHPAVVFRNSGLMSWKLSEIRLQ